jgi:hypothetical protein
MTIIQRPGYPFSLSLTGAIAHLMYNYICDHYIGEFLIYNLILEKSKKLHVLLKNY